MSSIQTSKSVIKGASLGSKIVEAVAPPLSEVILDEIKKNHKRQDETTQTKQNWSSKESK